MTEEEIEVVAEELAKAGGTAWHPGRQQGPLMRVVSDRYRDRARLAIAALERYRASRMEGPTRAQPAVSTAVLGVAANSNNDPDSPVRAGCTVVYRPPGERRAYPCRVEKVEGNRAYLVPHLASCTGWVSLERLWPALVTKEAQQDG